LGRDFARQHSANYLEFQPDWEKLGKSAGFARNADIVKNSDYVVAFWDGQSKGTRHSLELAQKAGKPYFAYNFLTQKEARFFVQGNPSEENELAHTEDSQFTDMGQPAIQAAPSSSLRLR
jgi:hypothetical protein